MESIDSLGSMIDRFALQQRRGAILAASLPGVQIFRAETDAHAGRTHSGGQTRLRATEEWPTEKSGQLLRYVRQIDLPEIHAVMLATPIRASGLVSFFYDIEEQPCGEYADHPSCKRRVLSIRNPRVCSGAAARLPRRDNRGTGGSPLQWR